MQTLVSLSFFIAIAACTATGSALATKAKPCKSKADTHASLACALIATTLTLRWAAIEFSLPVLLVLTGFVLGLLGCYQLFLSLSALRQVKGSLNTYAWWTFVGGSIATCLCFYIIPELTKALNLSIAACILLLCEGTLYSENQGIRSYGYAMKKLLFLSAFALFFHGVVSAALTLSGEFSDLYLLHHVSLILVDIATIVLAFTLFINPLVNQISEPLNPLTPVREGYYSREQMIQLFRSYPAYTTHSVILVRINALADMKRDMGENSYNNSIKKVVSSLRQYTREQDNIARLSNDTFAAVLKNVSEDTALTIADRFANDLTVHNVNTQANTPVFTAHISVFDSISAALTATSETSYAKLDGKRNCALLLTY